MELLGSSLDAERIGQLVQRPRQTAVQALASSVCHRLLKSSVNPETWLLRCTLTGGEEPGRCVGSNPTLSEVRIPSGLLPKSFTYKVATTYPELWRRFVAACDKKQDEKP